MTRSRGVIFSDDRETSRRLVQLANHSFEYPAAEADSVFFSTAVKALETAAGRGARTVTFHTARTRRAGTMADENGVFEKLDSLSDPIFAQDMSDLQNTFDMDPRKKKT